MRPDDGVACQVLAWLADREAGRARGYKGTLLARHQMLAEHYNRLPADAIRQHLPPKCPDDSRDMFSKAGMLFLETSPKAPDMIPIVSVKYDKVGDEIELRLRVGFFVPNDDPAKPNFAIGLRFEPPEGRREQAAATSDANTPATPMVPPGQHDFYHAQLMSSFVKGKTDRLLMNCPPWIPTSSPAIMLSARSSLGLVLNMLVGIYGLRAEIMRELSSLFSGVVPILTSGVDASRPG